MPVEQAQLQADFDFRVETRGRVSLLLWYTDDNLLTAETREVEPALMTETTLLERITVNPEIFGGKPIIRGRRLAVEHILGMLTAGDTAEIILSGYPWLEKEDIQACLVSAHRLVRHERIEFAPRVVA